MNGSDLLLELRRRIMSQSAAKSVNDASLAAYLGITQPALNNYKEKEITPRQIANLLDKASRKAETQLVNNTIAPIVEYFPINATETKFGGKVQIFGKLDEKGHLHPYLTGLREKLEVAHGIYVFHDSRGRAIYAGKAQRLNLWSEINNAYNRDRGEVQSIKRTKHPIIKVPYRGHEEKKRQIRKRTIALHDVAFYVSAYQVHARLISKLEAFIIRSFANDLLNVRMENF